MIRKRSLTTVLVISTMTFLFLSSCDPGKKYEKQEKEDIDNYLSDNSNLAFELKPSGLYYLDVQVGTGIMAEKSDTGYIMYTGKFLDGTVFDTNITAKDTLILPMGENFLIPGFEEGLSYMKAGGKSILLIPSDLGYGAVGRGRIGGYTPMVFDVELVRIKKSSAK